MITRNLYWRPHMHVEVGHRLVPTPSSTSQSQNVPWARVINSENLYCTVFRAFHCWAYAHCPEILYKSIHIWWIANYTCIPATTDARQRNRMLRFHYVLTGEQMNDHEPPRKKKLLAQGQQIDETTKSWCSSSRYRWLGQFASHPGGFQSYEHNVGWIR